MAEEEHHEEHGREVTISTMNTSVTISSTNKRDKLNDLIEAAERLVDKYSK